LELQGIAGVVSNIFHCISGSVTVVLLSSESFGLLSICFPLTFSAKVVVELAKANELLQAAVLLHPSFVTVDDIKGQTSFCW
jgi:hypothetical protein